jgi:integrase
MAASKRVKLTKTVLDTARPGTMLWDADMPGLALRVTPAGTKTWVIQFRTVEGVQGRPRVGGYPELTVEEARAQARLLLASVEKGKNPSIDRKALREAPTVADLAADYLGTYATKRGLRPATVRDARAVLNLVLPEIGRLKVANVTVIDIQRAHADAKATCVAAAKARADIASKAAKEADKDGDGKKRDLLNAKADRARARITSHTGSSQANRLFAVLSKMFNRAIQLSWRTDNPCSKSVEKYHQDRRRRNLGPNEVASLLEACDAYGTENAGDQTAVNAANAVRLLLFTGARLQEALKAEWGQFDLERGIWEKPSAHTKTKRQHWVELEGPALDLLREMREADPSGRFLFPGEPIIGPNGKPQVVKARADLKRPWKCIVQKAGLEDVRLHDLRRTTASFMLSTGASLASVGSALGHTQAATTASYAFLAPSVQREGLRRAGEKMAALKGTSKGVAVVPISAGKGT